MYANNRSAKYLGEGKEVTFTIQVTLKTGQRVSFRYIIYIHTDSEHLPLYGTVMLGLG